LRPTGAAVARMLGVPRAQRRRTVRRRDGGLGTEAHRPWALWPGDQVLANGDSGKRAKACAQVVPWGEERRTGERGLAPAPTALRYDRRPQTAVWPWKTAPGTYPHRLRTPSLREHARAARAETEDARAAIEAELQADQGGRPRHRRRQQRLAAQEARVFRTDLAPNLLAWTRGWMFRAAPFAEAGIYRRVKERWPIPGTVVVEEGHRVKRRLQTSHPLATPRLVCLARLLERFGTPGILRKS
jgi:hypothetical protein